MIILIYQTNLSISSYLILSIYNIPMDQTVPTLWSPCCPWCRGGLVHFFWRPWHSNHFIQTYLWLPMVHLEIPTQLILIALSLFCLVWKQLLIESRAFCNSAQTALTYFQENTPWGSYMGDEAAFGSYGLSLSHNMWGVKHQKSGQTNKTWEKRGKATGLL